MRVLTPGGAGGWRGGGMPPGGWHPRRAAPGISGGCTLYLTQTLGPILDGLMRNTPDALRAIELAERDGVGALVAGRDGPWGDYSQAPVDEQPDPRNVIEP